MIFLQQVYFIPAFQRPMGLCKNNPHNFIMTSPSLELFALICVGAMRNRKKKTSVVEIWKFAAGESYYLL